MRFRLTPRSMTLDDFDYSFKFEFRWISQICEPTAAKQMKIDPYCQRQNCSPVSKTIGWSR